MHESKSSIPTVSESALLHMVESVIKSSEPRRFLQNITLDFDCMLSVYYLLDREGQ